MLVNDWNAKNKVVSLYSRAASAPDDLSLSEAVWCIPCGTEGHLEASTHTPIRPLAIPVDRRTTGRWVHMVQHHLRARMKEE